jgi:prepilin-type N-terminal cleavage/methylation domain-containing protein
MFKIKKQPGFTLIELLLVLAIITILAAFTVPVFLNLYQKRDLKDQGRELIANMEEVRDKAMSTGSDYGLYFDNSSFSSFRGPSYQEASDIYQFNVSDNLTFDSINLLDNQIIFEATTGEVKNYSEDLSSVNLVNQITEESLTIGVNRLGVVDVY